MSWNGFAKLGLPPIPAAPRLFSENGASFEFSCVPSLWGRFQYTPKPPRTTNECCPGAPVRTPSPLSGDHAKPARGEKWFQCVVGLPFLLQPGSPGYSNPGGAPGNTLDGALLGNQQVTPTPPYWRFSNGVSTSYPMP